MPHAPACDSTHKAASRRRHPTASLSGVQGLARMYCSQTSAVRPTLHTNQRRSRTPLVVSQTKPHGCLMAQMHPCGWKGSLLRVLVDRPGGFPRAERAKCLDRLIHAAGRHSVVLPEGWGRVCAHARVCVCARVRVCVCTCAPRDLGRRQTERQPRRILRNRVATRRRLPLWLP
jgi:hypothetical protein